MQSTLLYTICLNPKLQSAPTLSLSLSLSVLRSLLDQASMRPPRGRGGGGFRGGRDGGRFGGRGGRFGGGGRGGGRDDYNQPPEEVVGMFFLLNYSYKKQICFLACYNVILLFFLAKLEHLQWLIGLWLPISII